MGNLPESATSADYARALEYFENSWRLALSTIHQIVGTATGVFGGQLPQAPSPVPQASRSVWASWLRILQLAGTSARLWPPNPEPSR